MEVLIGLAIQFKNRNTKKLGQREVSLLETCDRDRCFSIDKDHLGGRQVVSH